MDDRKSIKLNVCVCVWGGGGGGGGGGRGVYVRIPKFPQVNDGYTVENY